MKFRSLLPGLIWLVVSTILLALPKNGIPDMDFFDFAHLDKLVHIVMFCLLSGLFCYPLVNSPKSLIAIKSKCWSISFLVFLYGIAMEFVQKYFVPGRSFDLLDIACDGIGSFGGMLIVLGFYVKKIGPDGNRGRNQN